jgi:hypothetical protein
MKPLTIALAKGEQRQFQSIGWKTPSGDDCRHQFYALDPADKPLVVTLKTACPPFYVPREGAAVVFSCEPFPEAVCVEISRCRLLAPPCFASRADFDCQLPYLPARDPWRSVYWQSHHEVLILAPSDDGPLKKRLAEWRAKKRVEYEHRAGAWRTKIKQVATAALHELRLNTEEQRAERLVECQDQLHMAETAHRLKLTLAGVKRGCEGIRDAWMHEEWARKNGENLGAMKGERVAFRQWLETHTGTPANAFDARTGQAHQGIDPPSFDEKCESDPRFLEACALVRYRARFADNAASVVYLADCELRSELTAVERAEVAELTGTGNLQTQKPPAPTPWHSEGFATIRRCNAKGEMAEPLPLSNEFRALCQLLAERPDQIAQFSEIEPQIGTRAHDLDIAAKASSPAQKGERRVRDLLRTETGRRLQKLGVLTVVEVGREKFLKLTPPTPAA